MQQQQHTEAHSPQRFPPPAEQLAGATWSNKHNISNMPDTHPLTPLDTHAQTKSQRCDKLCCGIIVVGVGVATSCEGRRAPLRSTIDRTKRPRPLARFSVLLWIRGAAGPHNLHGGSGGLGERRDRSGASFCGETCVCGVWTLGGERGRNQHPKQQLSMH